MVKQYQTIFKLEGVDLEFTPEALGAIADTSIERHTGARGLRSVVENILLNTMYDIPSVHDVKKVLVNEDTVRKDEEPVVIKTDSALVS